MNRSLSSDEMALLPGFLIGLFSAGVGILTTPWMGVAAGAYALLVLGLLQRRRRTFHVFCMGAGMFLDLSLVLVLEVQRLAHERVFSGELKPLQLAHVGASSVALVHYFPVATLGVLRLRGAIGEKGVAWHRRLGMSAFVFRTAGFLLMFAMERRMG